MHPQNAVLRAGDISFRGVVFPWECDTMGHLNSKNYLGMFDQAAWHVFLALGYRSRSAARDGLGLADVSQQLTFKRELIAGQLVYIRSYVERVGTKSITMCHEMHDAETRDCVAVLAVTVAFLDLESRRAREIPPSIRAAAESWRKARAVAPRKIEVQSS